MQFTFVFEFAYIFIEVFLLEKYLKRADWKVKHYKYFFIIVIAMNSYEIKFDLFSYSRENYRLIKDKEKVKVVGGLIKLDAKG